MDILTDIFPELKQLGHPIAQRPGETSVPSHGFAEMLAGVSLAHEPQRVFTPALGLRPSSGQNSGREGLLTEGNRKSQVGFAISPPSQRGPETDSSQPPTNPLGQADPLLVFAGMADPVHTEPIQSAQGTDGVVPASGMETGAVSRSPSLGKTSQASFNENQEARLDSLQEGARETHLPIGNSMGQQPEASVLQKSAAEGDSARVSSGARPVSGRRDITSGDSLSGTRAGDGLQDDKARYILAKQNNQQVSSKPDLTLEERLPTNDYELPNRRSAGSVAEPIMVERREVEAAHYQGTRLTVPFNGQRTAGTEGRVSSGPLSVKDGPNITSGDGLSGTKAGDGVQDDKARYILAKQNNHELPSKPDLTLEERLPTKDYELPNRRSAGAVAEPIMVERRQAEGIRYQGVRLTVPFNGQRTDGTGGRASSGPLPVNDGPNIISSDGLGEPKAVNDGRNIISGDGLGQPKADASLQGDNAAHTLAELENRQTSAAREELRIAEMSVKKAVSRNPHSTPAMHQTEVRTAQDQEGPTGAQRNVWTVADKVVLAPAARNLMYAEQRMSRDANAETSRLPTLMDERIGISNVTMKDSSPIRDVIADLVEPQSRGTTKPEVMGLERALPSLRKSDAGPESLFDGTRLGLREVNSDHIQRTILPGEIHECITVIADKVKEARLLMNKGRSELQMRLKPEHLGPLKINLTEESGAVIAKLQVSNEEARQIIRMNLPLLREALAENSLHVASFNVSVDGQLLHPENSGHGTAEDSRIPYHDGANTFEAAIPEAYEGIRAARMFGYNTIELVA